MSNLSATQPLRRVGLEMKNLSDIVLLLTRFAEEGLDDVCDDRMHRVVSENAHLFNIVAEGLRGAGHRHLARSVDEMVRAYGTRADGDAENEHSARPGAPG